MPISVDPKSAWVYPTSPLAKIAVPRVPNIGPGPSAVTILNPQPGAVLTGAVPVVFETDNDSELGTSYLAVDGVLYACIEGGGHGFETFDSSQLADGAHTVAVYCGMTDCEATGRYASSGTVAVTSSNHYTYPNTAVHFGGGANQYAALTDAAFNASGSGFTVAAWINLDPTYAACDPVSHYAGADGGWEFHIAPSNNFATFFVFNSALGATSIIGATITTGTWHLWVGTYDGQTNGTMKMSVDGANFSTATMTGSLATSSRPLKVAGLGTSVATMLGALDSVGHWSRPLSQAEALLLWDGGIGLSYHDVANIPANSSLLTGLTAWYDSDDAGGQNLADATGNGRTLLGANGTSTYTGVTGKR
jgi:hypothetical protein